jgi:hypothetical protein
MTAITATTSKLTNELVVLKAAPLKSAAAVEVDLLNFFVMVEVEGSAYSVLRLRPARGLHLLVL